MLTHIQNTLFVMKKLFFAIALLFITLSISAQKEINQYNPKSIYEEGVLLFENQHYASAIKCFEQYLSTTNEENENDAVMAKYYEAISSLYLEEGDGENKIRTFIKENPTSLMVDHAKFVYSNYLFKSRKYRDALKTYNSINSANLNGTDRDECDFKKAYCYYQTQNIAKATPIFEKLARTNNQYRADATYYYAHILYINGKQDKALEYFNSLKNNSKYKDIADIYILQINFDKGNYNLLTEKGDDILQKAHKNRKADIALMIAESWMRQGDYKKSLEYYDIMTKNSRRKIAREIEFNIGFCKMKNEDYEGAIEHFTKVANKNDELAQYSSYYMGQCYSNTKQDKFARNTYLKAYKMDFNDTLKENALYNYAVLSFIPGIDPFGESINMLNDYISKNPQSAQISDFQDIVIHLLLNSNDYDNVLKTLEQYENLSPELKKIQSELTYNLGIQHYNEGNYNEAIKYFEKSSKNKDIESNCQKESIYWLADSYHQLKDYDNALKTYNKFINTKGANNLDIYASAYYNLGYIYLDNSDFNNASIKFKEFINNDRLSDKERQGDAWLRIGDCYFIQHQYNNAITSYNNSLKISNKNADYAYFQQAMGYGALGKTKEKINSLNIIANRHQRSNFYDKAIYEIGMTYLNSNDHRSAIASFDKIVKERPRSQYARKSLMKIGMIHYNNDENDKALERLKTIVAQYPNTEESREALNIIGNIYRDNNEIQEYFNYITENNLAEISVDKQDSLTFKNIEEFYSSKKYNETIKGARQYIENHPNGAYLLDVHYYAMSSMEQTDETEGIRTHIEYILGQSDNDYTDKALLLIARMDYDESNYSTSAEYYERLLDLTDNQYIITEAIEGCMKSYYFDGKYDEAIEKANKLIGLQEITQNKKNQANYILGKSFFDKKDYAEAYKYLETCSGIDNSATGAECAYLSAICLYEMAKYDEAEEKVFFVSDKFGNYLSWTARSFITLSDVYVAKDNIFQAKETLKSVIDNYPKEEPDYNEIVGAAQEKLNIIDQSTNE